MLRLIGGESSDYVYEVDTTDPKGPHACTRRGRKEAEAAGHDER